MVKKKYYQLFVFNFVVLSVSAQQNFSVRTGFDLAGSTMGYHFLREGNVLQKYGGNAVQLACPIKLQYIINQNWGIELACQITHYTIGAENYNYRKQNGFVGDGDDDDSSTIIMRCSKYYLSPSLAFYRYFPMSFEANPHLFFYVGAGLLLNYRSKKREDISHYFYRGSASNLNMVTQFNTFFPSGYIEAGYNYNNYEKSRVLYIGFKYVFAPQMMVADYSVISGNKLITSDQVVANGSYFALSVQYGLSFNKKVNFKPKLRKKKEYTPDYHKLEQDSLLAVKAEQDSATVQRIKAERGTALVAMENRPFETTYKIKVHSQKLLVKIWDDEVVDDDIVSLNLNGEWVLKEYNLTSNKNIIEVTLNPGENNLVLYAISEGRKKPCSVAISFDDGHKIEKLAVDSDFKKSSCVQINYVPLQGKN